MNRRFSLRRGAEFQRVWDDGHSWTHPLIILRVRANGMETSRFGFVAGKKVGKATARNYVKRLMREVVRQRLGMIAIGWDIILIARGAADRPTYKEMVAAVESLFRRAHLITN